MSTRAVFTFKDPENQAHIYSHGDGYPTGAVELLQNALRSGKVWPLPRFEAVEFSAGFVAANKTGFGGIRILKSRRAISDVEYGYSVCRKTSGEILLTVSTIDGWRGWKEKTIWTGNLVDFTVDIAKTLQ